MHSLQLVLLIVLLLVLLQAPLASIPQFYYPGGAEPMDEEIKQQFMSNVNSLFDPHPAGLNLEQFSAVVQEVSCTPDRAV